MNMMNILDNKDNIEKITAKIINMKDDNNIQYVDKYNKNWIIDLIQEKPTITIIGEQFKEYDISNGVDIVDFVTIFLTAIEHTEYETLYICFSLIDLFKEICEFYELINLIKHSDLLNYLVEVRVIFSILIKIFSIEINERTSLYISITY